MTENLATRSWSESFQAFFQTRVIVMLFLGFSAGIPLLLIFSSLGLWLSEAGQNKSAITYFSWAALGYSFKFVWAPLVDKLPLPILTRALGRRRAWLLVAQIAVLVALVCMATIDPADGDRALFVLALATVALGFSSATQDIVIDAYRIESGTNELQALMSATYIAGYRIGMITSGAGALYLADIFGSTAETYNYVAWMKTYLIMASTMLVGIMTTLLCKEPSLQLDQTAGSSKNHLRFLMLFLSIATVFVLLYFYSNPVAVNAKQYLTKFAGNQALSSFTVELLRLALAILCAFVAARVLIATHLVDREVAVDAYVKPVRDFFDRHGLKLALLMLCLIGLYRVSDIVLGVISNLFYQDIGFSKTDIASVSKVFGLWMTILGGFLGGLLAVRFGVMRTLLLGAVLAAVTNLLFIWLSHAGNNMTVFIAVISADNLSGGLASAAFVAFLSSLTNIRFTAVQYAIFSSLMTLIPKVLGGYSGSMVENMGYSNFFTLTCLMTVPVIFLILIVGKHYQGEFKLAERKSD